jgi:polysaccharide biosynthesis/export protein
MANKLRDAWEARVMPLHLIRHAAVVAACALCPSLTWAQSAMPMSVSSLPSGYRINPGDLLEIHVWGDERLQRQVKVLPDGTIAFPLIGQILAQGFLPRDLEAVISHGLKEQYRGQVPQVTVSVVSPAGLQFSIMGRVKSPGTFTPGRYVNVVEALTLAGGPNEFANLDNVVIIRKSGEQLRSIRVKMSRLLRGGISAADQSNNITIQPGDVIIVP